jgi:hypothetical protein
MTNAERLQQHLSTGRSGDSWKTVPLVRCKNGFTMSVQASPSHMCSPKSDVGPWTMVEVAFPSKRVMVLAPHREGYRGWRKRPPLTQSLYPYVPVDVVVQVIEANGGFA